MKDRFVLKDGSSISLHRVFTDAPSNVHGSDIQQLVHLVREQEDKLHRRNMQIKKLKKQICVDFNTCREKRQNLNYCNADFYCLAVGNTPETKGCLTCEHYFNR